jgi:hypothetical protein
MFANVNDVYMIYLPSEEVGIMLAKQNKNGAKGEARTEAVLLDEFWVLRRSVDVEGADFLVQLPSDSLEELRVKRDKIQIFGIVQAKYFEGRNQVRIKKKYVLDNGKPLIEFFAFLHTDDIEGEKQHYFFTAQDIINEFYLDSNGEYYCFSLTNERDYSAFKNIKDKKILGIIRTAILQAEYSKNQKIINKLYQRFSFPTQHYDNKPKFIYKLRIVEKHHIVLCFNEKTEKIHLLEYRRDLHDSPGSFTWGYCGGGAYFLSICLLAHHFDGVAPSKELILRLLYNLIANLKLESERDITTEDLCNAISKPYTLPEAKKIKLPDSYFDKVNKKTKQF